jgi:hypothetical protein
MNDYLNISCVVGSKEADLFVRVCHIGIDHRLEGFIKSKFKMDKSRLVMDFHKNEIQILLRRLEEVIDSIDFETNDDDEIDTLVACDMWIRDIVESCYGEDLW